MTELDALGIKRERLDRMVKDGALIDGAVLIVRVHADDGTGLHVLHSEGLDWIARRGMLTIAAEVDGEYDMEEDE